MNLLQRYSLDMGVKYEKQFIAEQYFPIPFEKYITVHNSGKGETRKYDYFDEVVALLKEAAPDYKIVQIGSKDEPAIEGVDLNLLGQTNMRAMAFVVKNAAVHIGPDSFPVHLAAHFDTPFVGLYPQMYSSQSRPLFGDASKQVILESDRKGQKPTYSLMESPKTINTIYPDTIANHALKLLGQKPVDKKILFISEGYSRRTLNVVPLNTESEAEIPAGGYAEIIIHADILIDHLNETRNPRAAEVLNQSVMSTLEKFGGTKVRLRTSAPIHPAVLDKYKDTIGVVEFVASQYINDKYLKIVQKSGVNYSICVKNDDNEAKLAFLDHPVTIEREIKNDEYKNFLAKNPEVLNDMVVKSNFVFVNNWNTKSITNYESILIYQNV